MACDYTGLNGQPSILAQQLLDTYKDPLLVENIMALLYSDEFALKFGEWVGKTPADQNKALASMAESANKLFNAHDRELKKGAVVEYNGKKYLFWNENAAGKAQLINTDGTKFSGTPNLDKITVLGNYKTTVFNNTEYIVTDNNNVYSGATGNLVYTGKDGSSVAQKSRIIEQAKLENNINQDKETIDNTSSSVQQDVQSISTLSKAEGFIPLNIEGINAGKTKDTAKMKLGNKLIAFGTPGSATQHYADEASKKQSANSSVKTDNSNKINIYAGTNENADLSNFAIRPFTINVETPSGEKEFTFQSVEQAFHFYKTIVANRPDIGKKILNTSNGATLKSLTNRNNLLLTQEQLKEWDSTSKSIMLNLMFDSFSQNKEAADRLVNTGNATLTHKRNGVEQDNGRFSEVISVVRDMLKEEGFGSKINQFKNQTVNSGIYSSNDIVNISVVGKERPNQAELVEKTKQEILKAAEQGVNYFVADTKETAKSPHNINGEGVIADWFTNELPKLGYNVEYGETKDGHAGIYKVVKVNTQQISNNPSEYTNHSGGAKGYDIERRRQEELTNIIQSIFPNTKLNQIVYHGTRTQERFDRFDENRIGELDSGYFGRGFYFSPDKSYAEGYSKQYNGYTIAAIVNLQSPLETDANKANTNISLENNDGAIVRVGEDLNPMLNSNEYDPNEIGEVVVKSSEQIHILSEQELNDIKEINAKYDAELDALNEQVTPEQKQQVQQLYSQYLEQNPNGSVEEFKNWINNKNNFDEELAQKIQDKLQKLYPEIGLNITNNPVWEQGDNVFNQEEYNNQVNYRLKATEKVLNNLNKIKQWESNKSIDQNTLWKKIGELGISKQQLELLRGIKQEMIDNIFKNLEKQC